jgi:hypothetical protein
MQNFILAFREYKNTLKVSGTNPTIFYTRKKGFQVSWYFKKETILKNLKAEIIYGGR